MASVQGATPISSMGTDGAHHKDFIAWAQQVKGVQIHGVEPASFPGAGIGMVATRKITAGHVIVFVPASSLVTVDPDINQKTVQGPLSIHGRLALSLLRASDNLNETSTLAPWQRAMPNRADVFDGMPVRWPAALHAFFSQGVKPLLENQMKNYKRDTSAFRTLLDTEDPRPSEAAVHDAEDAYAHAWLLVNSRSFYWDYPKTSNASSAHQRHRGKALRKRPRDDCMALCPFIDYFNHVAGSACAQVEYNTTGFTARSDRDYEAGEEINVSYGAHSNDFLMVEYGFVMSQPPNESDWTPLDDFVLPLLDSEQKTRLEQSGLLGKYVLDADGAICHRTQCALRALLLPLRKWERFVTGANDGEKEQGKVDELLREKVLKEYTVVIDAMLKGLSSVEQSYARSMLVQRWRQIGEMVHKAEARTHLSEMNT